MFQHGSQIDAVDNPMQRFAAPAFPEKNKTLESIPETNRESYVDLSEFNIQPNGFFQSPQKQGIDTVSDRFSGANINQQGYVLPNINSQSGPQQTEFNSGLGYMGTQYANVNNPNILQAPTSAYSGAYNNNFYMHNNNNAQNANQGQGINQQGQHTGTGFSYTAGSQQNIGSQSNFGFGSYNPAMGYDQQNNNAQINANENRGENGGEGGSDVTEDTEDLSHVSIGNFKKAFHNKNNSYNLNLTKMDKSLSRTNSQPPTPENQNISQGFMKKNMQANYGAQPTDLLNMVNSNAFAGTVQANNPGQEAANNKPAEKKFKVRNESKDLESLIAQLDPLDLSAIAPLSENFLDDDEEENGPIQARTLTKKHSKGKEEEVKKKETKNIGIDYTPPAATQNLPTIKEETQYSYNSNYNSQAPVKTESASQIQLGFSSQKLIENYASTQSAPGGYTSTGLQMPNYGIETNITANPVGTTYSTGYTSGITSTPVGSKYQFGYLQGVQRPGENAMPTQAPSTYALESKDKGYLSPYTPQTNEKQLSTNMSTPSYLSPTATPFNYSSNPTSTQVKPTDFQTTSYQVSSINYLSTGTPSVQTPGSVNSINNIKPLRQSQMIPVKEYHNPFASSSTNSSNPQSNQTSQYHSFTANPVRNDQYQSAPINRQPNESAYRMDISHSPTHKVEEEADEIVNKMQNLYKDWKQKNAELNLYLNELVNTASQSHSQNRTGGTSDRRDTSPSQTFRKTVQGYSVQRNTISTNDKSSLPYDFRYSVKVPSQRENFQAFMNEDFLQGVEQSEEKKITTKPEFKKFSNPIFDKSAFGKEDASILRPGHQRDSSKSYFTQEEANFPRSQQGNSSRHTYGEQNIGSVQLIRPERYSEGYEFKPKFTKHHHEQELFTSSSPPKSERMNIVEKNEYRDKFNFPVNKYQVGYEHFKHTLFGFNVKKARLIEGVDKRRINTKQMEIICMNCQEFIPINEVDRHSEMCNKFVRKQARNIEAFVYEDVNELNNKLRNIRQRIIAKFSSLNTKKSLEMKIKMVIRCIDSAISQNNDLSELRFLVNEGEKLISAISNDDLTTQEMSLLVYLNRFVVIVKEKYAEIQVNTLDMAEIEELKTKRHEYEREVQKQKADLDEMKDRAQMMMNVQLSNNKGIYYVKTQYTKEDEVISQINSDIESARDDYSDDGLSIMSVQPLPIELPVIKTPAESTRSEGNKEGNKIKFYSMVVNEKLSLPPQHPGKDILISDLYDECLELNLQEEQWAGFIKRKLGL